MNSRTKSLGVEPPETLGLVQPFSQGIPTSFPIIGDLVLKNRCQKLMSQKIV